MHYQEAFSDLAGVYLEDSWVLEVAPSDDGLALRVEAVLTPEHSCYEPPKPSEQYCYRSGWLTVQADSMEITLSGRPPATDAAGEADFGNVDAVAFDPTDGHWKLEGEWGYARGRDPKVTLRFD